MGLLLRLVALGCVEQHTAKERLSSVSGIVHRLAFQNSKSGADWLIVRSCDLEQHKMQQIHQMKFTQILQEIEAKPRFRLRCSVNFCILGRPGHK